MADEAANAGAAPQAPQVKLQILGQYTRDMSFENIVAQKNLNSGMIPAISVQVSLEARKKKDVEHRYEVFTKYKIEAKNKDGEEVLFLLELDYGGIFHIENVPEEQMHPFLMIECPRMLFPFARRIVHDVIRDGGFPPVNLDTIDWVSLYRNNLMQQAAAAQAAGNTQ